MKKWLLTGIGIFIVAEALLSLLWKYNDKSILAQGARTTRMVAGGIVTWLAS